jgi:sulfur-oxidizing protein SoxY
MEQRSQIQGPTRRLFLAGAGALLVIRPAGATPDSMAAAINQVAGGKPVTPGKVKLSIPPLVENGNTVAVTVAVDSPMTEKDHVTAIYVFTEKNPLPNVIGIRLGVRAGKAEVSTRIRLADTQQVVAICQMSDGSFWSDKADVILTLSACLEDPI